MKKGVGGQGLGRMKGSRLFFFCYIPLFHLLDERVLVIVVMVTLFLLNFLDIDSNKDGYVSLDEFLGDYRDPDDSEAEEPEWVKEETKKFKEEYDKNHDGKLDKDEVGECLLCT